VSWFLPGWAGPQFCFMIPAKAGMTGVWNHAQFCPVEMGVSETFWSRLPWNHDPLDLSLPRRLWWQVHATVPSYWLRRGLVNFCSGLSGTTILLISSSQVARIIGTSHQQPVLLQTFKHSSCTML
jgi:hypothetical protein